MNDILNADQIAAIFEAAKTGHVPEIQAHSTRRQQRLRSVDFTRPTKFTTDHQRRINRAIDGFCLGAAGRLTAELRSSVEFETLNTTQVTWAAAQASIPTHSLAVTLEVRPLGSHILMTVEASFVLAAIECLLGGGAVRTPRERRFSEIDWTLSRRLLESITSPLSAAWADLGGLSFEIDDMEFQTDSTSIAPVSEPTYVVMAEIRMNQQSAAMALLIPWIAIDPVADVISGRDPLVADERGDSGMGRALSAAPVTLRAEVAALDLPVSDILSLQPGSVIRLGAPADEGVQLYAENVRLGRADPGANGSRRAIQVRGLDAEQ
jgi:flagellar motor switch protein FliM